MTAIEILTDKLIEQTIKLHKTTVVHRSFMGDHTSTKVYYSTVEIYDKSSDFYTRISSSIEYYKIIGLEDSIDDSHLPLILDGFNYKYEYRNIPTNVFHLPINEPFELI